jgi:hypothetical protein
MRTIVEGIHPGVCCLVVGGCLLLASGCGPKGLDLAPVRGRITLDGKPIANAGVGFISPSAAHPATANTDSDGNYRLRTLAANDGAVVDDYVVTVVLSEDPNYGTSRAYDPHMIRWIVPERYSNATTSGLRAKVTHGGPNVFDFDLSTQKR